jgi:hypothetical protein
VHIPSCHFPNLDSLVAPCCFLDIKVQNPTWEIRHCWSDHGSSHSVSAVLNSLLFLNSFCSFLPLGLPSCWIILVYCNSIPILLVLAYIYLSLESICGNPTSILECSCVPAVPRKELSILLSQSLCTCCFLWLLTLLCLHPVAVHSSQCSVVDAYFPYHGRSYSLHFMKFETILLHSYVLKI